MSFHILVQFDVPPSMREQFIQTAQANASSVDSEPGTLRFEVIADQLNRSRFYFDEVYADEAAFHTHCQGEKLQAFVAAISDYAQGPVILFRGIR